jgi:acetoin utilization deacetylase AcuC-like enzyme
VPARLLAIRRRIEREDPAALREAEPAPRSAVERVHPARYVDFLRDFSARGGGILNERDMLLNSASYDAALAAAGAALAAVRYACEGKGNAFAAVRPPGHHALAETAMGFCLLANAVIAAREAQHRGRDRVLIVDWDVHHGNGTQALIERDASVRFVSLHQWPLYPGTGAAAERGVGNVFNLPRPPGLPPERYVADLLAAVDQALIPGSPDLLIVSAGYDSMLGDPLGGFTLEARHYAELTRALRARCPGAPIVALLEGGYDPDLLAEGVLATLRALI